MADYMIGGVSVKELAGKLGTPLQIFDEERIENRMREYTENFKSEEFDTGVIYASKAFMCGAILELAKNEGLNLDVVSGGELHLAETKSFPAERIFFHGNNKSRDELVQAIKYGVGTIVLDNPQEAELLSEIAAEHKKKIDVLVRVNPGIEAHTHKYIMTAHLDSKFGMSIRKKDEFAEFARRLVSDEYINFRGLHVHIGSQIFDANAFAEAVRIICEFSEFLEKDCGIAVDTLDMGGGFAALYTASDKPIPIPVVCSTIIETATAEKKKRGLSVSRLLIEPGRSVAAEAGTTLYTVGFSKKTESKNYIFVDGGMSDNIRPALYQAEYDCEIITKQDAPKNVKTTVAGKCCESGDILIEEIMLPEAEAGDLLLVHTTGAYGYSMSSNYNRLPRPAAVFVKGGKARIVLRRETYEDIEKTETNIEI